MALTQSPSTSLSVRDLPRLAVSGVRLFARHWPALFVLAFLGVALRNAALWAAVEVSDHNGFLGQLLLVFTPLGYLLPIIAMLFICGRSLPVVREVSERSGPIGTTEQRPRRLVDVAVSVLVPFLVVYASLGLLAQDRLRFINAAAFDEFNRLSVVDTDYDIGSRVGIYEFQTLLVIVAIAWVVRYALGLAERRLHFVGLSVLGALVETYYTGQGAQSSSSIKNLSTGWVMDRQAVDSVRSAYDSVLGFLGPLAAPYEWVAGWVGVLVSTADLVIVMPLAWLSVGAVVLGHKLHPPSIGVPAERLTYLPARSRSLVAGLAGDVAERWSAFTGGLRMLLRAGLVPMLAFCLVFLLALRVPLLFSEAVRRLLGPTETQTWLAFSPWETGVGLALSMVVAAPLLAAALDLVLRTSVAVEDEINDAGEG